MKKLSPPSGFTLIELMVTIAILAIVLSVGIPSFRELILNNRLTAQANDFLGSLSFARSEAIKRGQRVTMCKTASPNTCDGVTDCCATTGNWAQGWASFVDINNNHASDDGAATLLKVHETMTGSTLTGNANVDDHISYMPSGISDAAGTLTLDSGVSGIPIRCIVINFMGRATISTKSSGACP